jgi:hypothetical protein
VQVAPPEKRVWLERLIVSRVPMDIFHQRVNPRVVLVQLEKRQTVLTPHAVLVLLDRWRQR